MSLNRAPFSRVRAFTIIEVMISMAIFMMVMASVYATWVSILRGSQAGLKAAAHAQRGRIALRTIQDALLTAVNFPDNPSNYWFLAKQEGNFANITFTARLPDSFPGVRRFGGAPLRQVNFFVEPGPSGNVLKVRQKPLLSPDVEEAWFELDLSPDVTQFDVRFYDQVSGEFGNEWLLTNAIPTLVQVEIGMGTAEQGNKPFTRAGTVVAPPGRRTGVGLVRGVPRLPGGQSLPPPIQ